MNDSSLALLALLDELKAASGYRVAAVAAQRGMERWAGLSTSSVYKGLRELRRQRLVTAAVDRQKTGRGPTGTAFAVSATGQAALRREILRALGDGAEHSVPFRLALAFITAVPAAQARAQLERRTQHLHRRLRAVEEARVADPTGALGASMIFAYATSGLRHELEVNAQLLQLLAGGGRT